MSAAPAQPNRDSSRPFDELGISFFVTGLDATILYANATLERKTGYSLGELVGKAPGKLWGGNMDRNFYDHMWNTIRDKQQPFSGDIQNSKRSGELFTDRIVVSPVVNTAGKIRYYIGVHSDATGKVISKDTEERLMQTLRQGQVRVGEFSAALGMQECITDQALDAFIEQSLIAPVRTLFYRRDEDRLLVLAAKEDSAKFSELYTKYRSHIFQFFSHRLGGETIIAEDLTQETFVRAFAYLPHFSSANASYLTYLLRIAHNILVNHYRSAKSQVDVDAIDVISDFSTEREMDEQHFWEKLWLLSDIERDILGMKYREGFSVKEIADSLGKSENAVKLHLSRGRKKLKGFIDKA